MIHGGIFLTGLAGFVLLLLAMARHQPLWLRRRLKPASSQLLRTIGFELLGLALLLAVNGFGWGEGTVAWFGWLTFAAAAVLGLHMAREARPGAARNGDRAGTTFRDNLATRMRRMR